MSSLDNIIKRAKQGSSGPTPSRLLSSNNKKIEDDDDYKTIVDKPSSTYALKPYKSTKSIPSTFTNDFERIYQVVKSSYNCGVKPNYIYEECKYNSLVQNYIQKGVADVSSMQGYSNVSLQDLPLACNIPSVVYQNCSPPTNMLTTEVTQTLDTGFRLNSEGFYIYPYKIASNADFYNYGAYYNLDFKNNTNINNFNKDDASFIVEKKNIKELDNLITTNMSYYERYNKYKNENPNITDFYYLKHLKSGKYVTSSIYYNRNIETSIFQLIIYNPSFIITIYNELLDEIVSIDNNLQILKNRTGKNISISRDNNIITINTDIPGLYPYKSFLKIGDITVTDTLNINNFYTFSVSFLKYNGEYGPTSETNFSKDRKNLLTLLPTLKYTKNYYYGLFLTDINYFYSNISISYSDYDIINIKMGSSYITKNPWGTLFIESNNPIPILIEKNYYPIQFYPTLIKYLDDSKFLMIETDDKLQTIFTYNKSGDTIRYTENYNVKFSAYAHNFWIRDEIDFARLSRDGKIFIIVSNNNLYYFYTNGITKLKTFDTRISKIALSFDANIVYVILENKKFFACFNKNIWKTLNDTVFLPTHFETSYKGKIIIYTDNIQRLIYLSEDYGNNFISIQKPIGVISSIRCYDENFYMTTSLNTYGYLYCFNFVKKVFKIILSAPLSNMSIINIFKNYIVLKINSSGYENNYIINTKNRSINNLYLKDIININNTLSLIITKDTDLVSDEYKDAFLIENGIWTDNLYKIYNTNKPQTLQDTPYTLNNGLTYPSYSFITSTISNQGVKNVFNANTYVLSSDTTIIKKIYNNLSITSSSILKNNTPIPSIIGSIRDISCSNNGQYILAAVYNGKLLFSSNYGTSFSEYNEAGRLTGNTSSNNISNVTRYWISVACSFSGKYMSACAYNGNIFISTNNGVLFTSFPENFAKKWVQIVMSKSSDDAKDGIIQFACSEDGLFISYDRGSNWSQISNELIDIALSNNGSKWSSVAISDSGQYMLATVYGGYVYASYNYGYDWSIYGVSRKECYEPLGYPDNQLSSDYLGYSVMASSTLSGNIINAFKDDNSIWSPLTSNSNVIIRLPYQFLLTDINIVNLTSEDVKISVSGSNDGSSWSSTPLGENLNLYSTVDNEGISYRWFRLTFSTSNIEIQRIKLLGKTDFVSGGIMSQIGNWSSCAIVNETIHYASIDSGSNAGLYQSTVSSSFGKFINIISNTDKSVNIYDKNNNIVTVDPMKVLYSHLNKVKRIELTNDTDIGRIEFPSVIPRSLFIVNENNVIYNSGLLNNLSNNLYPPISSNKLLLIEASVTSHPTTFNQWADALYDNNEGDNSIYNPAPLSSPERNMWIYFNILGASVTSLVYLTKFRIKFYLGELQAGETTLSNTISIYSDAGSITTGNNIKNINLLPDKKIFERQFNDLNIITFETNINPPVPVHKLLVYFSRRTFVYEIQFFSV